MSLSRYSCKICSSDVKDTDAAVLCDLCEKWIHTDCTSIGGIQCEILKVSLSWYCLCCLMETPLFTVKNKGLQIRFNDPHNNHPKSIPKKWKKKTKEYLKKYCEKSEISKQQENPLSCNYFDISDFKKLKVDKQQEFFIIHLNITSNYTHTRDLRAFLNLVNHKFDVICISQNIISPKHPQTINIYLPGFNIEKTSSESSAAGTDLYLSKPLI